MGGNVKVAGVVEGIFIAPTNKSEMQEVQEVLALEGRGLEGDRYAERAGSYSRKEGEVNRQVTLINANAFPGTGYEFVETRRNIVVSGVELNWLSHGVRFQIGEAIFEGVKYCDPCKSPGNRSGNPRNFQEAFFDRGGIVAKVIKGGLIRVGDPVVYYKDY